MDRGRGKLTIFELGVRKSYQGQGLLLSFQGTFIEWCDWMIYTGMYLFQFTQNTNVFVIRRSYWSAESRVGVIDSSFKIEEMAAFDGDDAGSVTLKLLVSTGSPSPAEYTTNLSSFSLGELVTFFLERLGLASEGSSDAEDEDVLVALLFGDSSEVFFAGFSSTPATISFKKSNCSVSKMLFFL